MKCTPLFLLLVIVAKNCDATSVCRLSQACKAWRGAADHLAEKLVLCADLMASRYAQEEARVRLASWGD